MATARARNAFSKISVAMLITAAAGFALLAFNQTRLFSVQSGSMSPYINKGDLLFVSQTSENNIKQGDVVTYVNPANRQQTITHRVTETPNLQNEDKFITKGDANPVSDNPIAPDFILGEVTFAIPFAGYGLDFARHPVGLFLLIYVPALIIMGSEIRRITEYYRSMQPYYANEAIRKKLLEREEGSHRRLGLKHFTFLSLFFLGLVTAQTYAAVSNPALLTGNRITITAPVEESVPLKPVDKKKTSCSNDMSVKSSTSQTSRSGEAVVKDNTNGGSAASGNASNSSSVSVEISTNCR